VSQPYSTWKAKTELVLILLLGEIQLARCIVHHEVDRRPNRQVLLDSLEVSKEFKSKIVQKTSGMDKHRFDGDTDPDPNFHCNAGPDPDWHQNDADPHADPIQCFAHIRKI
jgi:hypothetical protein